MSTALTLAERPQTALIRPVVAPAEVMEIHKQISDMVAKTLIEGKDFGTIPGTNKPSLYKAGGERLCVGFGLVDRYEIIEKEIDHNFRNEWVKRRKEWSGPKGQRTHKWVEETGVAYGLYRYTVKCLLYRREDDVLVAEGVGACSTLEAKYCDRPRDMENTILKMAKKRAKVDAVLTGLGLSDRFTQDIEDTGVGAGEVEDEHGQPTQRPTGDEIAQPAKPATEKRAKPVDTLEDAIAFPLPWPSSPLANTPLGQLRNNLLWAAVEWCEKAIKKAKDAGEGVSLRVQNLYAAAHMILEARERGELEEPPKPPGEEDPAQAKLFTEGEQGPGPTPAATSSDSSASTAAASPSESAPASSSTSPDPAAETRHPYRPNTLPEGRLALDALENTDPAEASAYQLGQLIKDALEKGPFTDDERKTLRSLFANAGMSTKKLAAVRASVLKCAQELPF